MDYRYREQPFGQPNESDGYPQSRVAMDYPRPREQRPILYPSLSDNSTLQSRPVAFDNSVPLESRSQHPCLPGVRDILTKVPTPSGPSTDAQRSEEGHSSPCYPRRDGHYHNRGLHPPMILPLPQVNGNQYHGPPTRTFDVPILDTTRINRHPPQSMPQSPFSGPSSSARDSVMHSGGARPAPIGTHMSNGTYSPYGPTVNEARQHPQHPQQPVPAPAYDRQSSLPSVVSSSETQRQYIGIREFPGEGPCHFYSDGSRTQTHVDGEYVNPSWGLTKALKPRKRLALACLDCREKKIKCEPGATACLQCEKAKRPCRRAPSQHSQSAASPSSWQGSMNSPVRKNPSTSDPTPATERSTDLDILNKRRDRADQSPPHGPSKKHRSTSPMSGLYDTKQETQPHTSTLPPTQDFPSIQASGKGLVTWENDPYEIHPTLTLHLIELYFEHMNSAVYWLYPREHFLHWVKTCQPKCQNERMVLYAMLAAASIFASNELAGFGKECAIIAGDAIASQIGKFNISVAHTKMMLALYHFARGSDGIPWDYIGSAIRTITFLQLNTEKGCYDDESSAAQPRTEFELSTEQLAESKRRTFWSCFLMDRLSGTTVCQIKPQDIFLRLPCAEDAYEQSIKSDAPYFPNANVEPTLTLLTPASPLSPMAWMALVAGIWGDVIDFTLSAPHRPASSYRESYETFYSDIRNRLQGWASRLPAYMQYSEANLAESVPRGYFHAFVCMHTLYHTTHMKLNRCLRHAQMPDVMKRNIREAHSHAQQQLRIMTAVIQFKQVSIDAQSSEPTLSIPFAGYGILTAIDIVSAGGPESSLQPTLELIEGPLVCLRELSGFWDTAKHQFSVCAKRYYQIKNVVTGGQKSNIGAWLGRNWGIDKPIDKDLRMEDDCIYGLGDSMEAVKAYFEALAGGDEGQGNNHRALRIGIA